MQEGVGVGVTVRAHWADYEFAAKMQTSAIELWVCCVRFLPLSLHLRSPPFSSLSAFAVCALIFSLRIVRVQVGVGYIGDGSIGQAVNALNFCAKCNCILFHVPSSVGALPSRPLYAFYFQFYMRQFLAQRTQHWAPLRPLPIFECFIINRVGHMRCDIGRAVAGERERMKYQSNKLKSQKYPI